MGDSLRSFASTAGWTLGDRDEGADYFSKLPIVDLTPAQGALAIRVAESTFRPCCDNSTFFQDCNHGSALYGLLAGQRHDARRRQQPEQVQALRDAIPLIERIAGQK